MVGIMDHSEMMARIKAGPEQPTEHESHARPPIGFHRHRSVDDIRTIVAELRKQRVVYFRDGEFEVRLADVPESGEVSYE